MGQILYDEEPAARAVFHEADDALGFSLSQLCFEGPESDLVLTANTQPAILTVSVALARALGDSPRPDVVAGHSLGEYTANVFAGTLSFADAVRVVHERGRLMQEAVPVGQGAMSAVLGGDRDAVMAACRETGAEVANFNSPGQIVIAGRTESVRAAGEKLKALGARVMPLPVSAPFHCSAMKPVEDRMVPLLHLTTMHDPSIPIVCNVDATVVTTADAARDALGRQVSRSVRWDESVRHMVDVLGVRTFVEIGPGKVLSGLVGRIEKAAKRLSLSDPKELAAVRALAS